MSQLVYIESFVEGMDTEGMENRGIRNLDVSVVTVVVIDVVDTERVSLPFEMTDEVFGRVGIVNV